jgi:hypothetical protein
MRVDMFAVRAMGRRLLGSVELSFLKMGVKKEVNQIDGKILLSKLKVKAMIMD